MRRWLLLAVLILAAALPAGGSGRRPALAANDATAYTLETDMYGDEMVPAVDTVAWGFVRFFYNADRSEADYTVDVKGLSSNIVTGADMHMGVKGVNGPVVHHLADGDFLTVGGHIKFSKTDLADMAAGLYYVSLTSDMHPEGEMRGQIVLPPDFMSPNAQSEIGPFPPTATPTKASTSLTSTTSQIITGVAPTLTPSPVPGQTILPTLAPPSSEPTQPVQALPTPIAALPTPRSVPTPPVPQPEPAEILPGVIHPPNTGDGGLAATR